MILKVEVQYLFAEKNKKNEKNIKFFRNIEKWVSTGTVKRDLHKDQHAISEHWSKKKKSANLLKRKYWSYALDYDKICP